MLILFGHYFEPEKLLRTGLIDVMIRSSKQYRSSEYCMYFKLLFLVELHGYLAPEFVHRNVLTTKSDIIIGIESLKASNWVEE
ncbi:hypothetical protein MKW98_003450 [Papaver atlanticum]|uniref:Uncharacterized protein n=1 Tax=Papaver atlanticum TaxID=357466 RepID=A0AAD4XUT7_9MAGN|nr:hypothetical protein MKW98_003450 [Papaver atlanticum]